MPVFLWAHVPVFLGANQLQNARFYGVTLYNQIWGGGPSQQDVTHTVHRFPGHQDWKPPKKTNPPH